MKTANKTVGKRSVAALAAVGFLVYLLFRKNKYENDRLTIRAVEAARAAVK